MSETPSIPIYFDNHATTPLDPRVLESMLPFFMQKFGNAASINHSFGEEAVQAVEHARLQIARSLQVDPSWVAFTSGATEANNLAIKGLLQPLLRRGERAHVVTNSAEHRAVLDPISKLKRSYRNNLTVTVLEVNPDGCVPVDSIRRAISDGVQLVSVMWANNEIGSINDINAIAAACQQQGTRLHVDAVQAFGKLDINMQETPIDLLSVTAHKINGPKGVGALVTRRTAESGLRLEALQDGGGHENHLRSGTLPVPLIVGFGEAVELAVAERETENVRIRDLRERLWTGLCHSTPGLVLNGSTSNRLPGNLNFSVPNVDGEVLMNSMVDIAVSSGSACTSANPEPSHVLRAIGRSDQLIRASLRFGIGRFNTAEEVDFAISYVSNAIRKLRG